MNVKKLELLIDGKKITKAFLIRKAGITRPTLDAILEGKDFKVSNLERIAMALKVPVGYFFDETITAPTIVEAEDHSFALNNSPISIGDIQGLQKEISMLEKLIGEKDERIKELKERIEELKTK